MWKLTHHSVQRHRLRPSINRKAINNSIKNSHNINNAPRDIALKSIAKRVF